MLLATVLLAQLPSTSSLGMINTVSLGGAISWSIVGYLCIAIGMVATLLSSYRYLLAYLLAGMMYWVVVEGIQFVVYNASSLSAWHSYVAALSLTWLLPSLYLLYRYGSGRAASQSQRATRSYFMPIKGRQQADTYIEHTPIYNNYTPRFHN